MPLGLSASILGGGGGSGGSGSGASTALFTATAGKTVANTVSETTIIGTGVGSTTTAANYFVAGMVMKVEFEGFYSSQAVDTLNIKLKAGSTVVASTGAIAYGALTNKVAKVSAMITCRTAGATGTFIVNTIWETGGSALIPQNAQMLNTATVTLDTTVTQAWDLTATWSAASASDTITGSGFAMYVIGSATGGTTSPAGSNNDIQINSSGSFGALTPGTGVATFLATPSGANLATALTTALPATKGGTGLTSLGTGVATALGINVGTAGAPVVLNGAGGTPSAIALTNATNPPKIDVLQGSEFAADAGASDAYAITLSPAATAYVTGTRYRFKANTANTGPATLNVNAIGAITIVKLQGGIATALADNDIRAGQWVECVYDGTNMQMISAGGNTASGTGTVTVVSSGSLTSTALVTGGGTTTLQTPAATATMDASGNISTPGTLSVGSGASTAGAMVLTQGTTQSIGTTNITLQAPTSVTSYIITLPSAVGSTGLMQWTVSGSGATLSAVTQLPSNITVDGTNLVGYRGAPQQSKSAAYTTVLADAGCCIFHPSSDANARTFTIDSNANVAYVIGTIIEFINMSANNVTIAITSDTMTLLPAGTTGSRTLAQYGRASAEKISSTAWIISGNSALT